MRGHERSVETARDGPWFRQHKGRAMTVAGFLFAAVFVLRANLAGSDDAISALYVLPVALLALAFGLRVGIAAGAGAVALLVGRVLVDDVTLTPLGWASRAMPLLLLGGLLGSASDRLRDADRRERHFERVALLHREAAELNDAVIQTLAVAKWSLEAGDTERGLEAVTETMETAQTLVSRMLGPDSTVPADRLRSRPTALAPQRERPAPASPPGR